MQTIKTKISVVTPSFNQGQYIEETIKSVLLQNYKNFEHIIIDAGSTDNTLEILEKYPHIKWLSEQDKGQSDGLNKGFRRVTTEWVIWLNADDILLPGAIQKYSDTIGLNNNADVIHGHMQFFLDGSKEISKRQYFNRFSWIKTIYRIVIPPTTGTLFKTKVLLENPLDIDFHYMMDAEWFNRCGKKLTVLIIDDFLVKFRISNTNKTSNLILAGKLNPQILKEKQLLYDRYTSKLFKKLPKGIQKYYFTFMRSFLLNWNRLQKLKYYLLIDKISK